MLLMIIETAIVIFCFVATIALASYMAKDIKVTDNDQTRPDSFYASTGSLAVLFIWAGCFVVAISIHIVDYFFFVPTH